MTGVWDLEFGEVASDVAIQTDEGAATYPQGYSKDALDQWSLGHGRAFLNEYKSKIDLRYFAELKPSEPKPAKVFARSLPIDGGGNKSIANEDIVKLLADAIRSNVISREFAFKFLYRFVLDLQRTENFIDRDYNLEFPEAILRQSSTQADTKDVEEPALQTPAIRDSFVPLPLRDRNVSICSKFNLLPDLGDLPVFEFPVTDGETQYPTACVGVIDDAINFTNQRFQAEWGTRTEFAWIQDAAAQDPLIGPDPEETQKRLEACEEAAASDIETLTCKDTVYFGREYAKSQIDHEIERHPDDPDQLLRAFELGPISTLDRPVGYVHGSHGTHVADLATGYGPSQAEHHNIRMQCVQLPALAYFDNSGMAMSYFILEGAKFILWRSLFLQLMMNVEQTLKGEELTKLPVILNISYGLSGGPHSGGHYLENGLDQLINSFNDISDSFFQLGPVDVVVPAGNDFLSRRFASAKLGESELSVTMRVPARDRTSSFLEVWLPRNDGVEVVIVPPGGLPPHSGPLEPNRPRLIKSGDDVIARLTLDKPFDTDPNLVRVLLAIAPTDTVNTTNFDRARRAPAEPGRWHVTVKGQINPKEVIEAYIHSEDPNNGFVRKDPPCYFDMPDYERHKEGYRDWKLLDGTSPVKRFGSLNGFGNGRFATVVGAYRIKTLKESLYSGAARRLAQSYYGRTPSLMAPADLSRLNRGILASGTRSGSSFTQTGTSISAPFITRALAEAAGTLSAVSEVLETAAEFEEEIGNMPIISNEQMGEGRYPLKNLPPDRELQLKRGLYER